MTELLLAVGGAFSHFLIQVGGEKDEFGHQLISFGLSYPGHATWKMVVWSEIANQIIILEF